MITYVCIYNNLEQLTQMLLPSLGVNPYATPGFASPLSGLIPCHNGNLLLIDNRARVGGGGGAYPSAAKAYNAELSIHQQELNDILVFCHQDIVFGSHEFAEMVTTHLQKNPRQLLGVAGMPQEGRTISNLKYFATKEYITRTQLHQIAPVESLDECCFALRKDLFFSLLFHETICDHWHLYAVELCYRARLLKQATIAVLPVSDVFHKMDGSGGLYADRHFLSSCRKLAWTYRKDFPTIYTPCYIVSTSPLKMMFKLWKTYIGNLLRRHHG